MTSAPNHQQPLNGNKVLFLFLIPLTFFSCGAFTDARRPQPPAPEPMVVITNDVDSLEEPPAVEPMPEVVAVTETVNFYGEEFAVPVHDRDFQIAVLLPFHTGYKRPDEKLRSDLMYEYLQGVKVALSEMEGTGIRYSVKVYDTDNDTILVKRILRRSELKEMDLIIGPTEKEQVRIAARFAREHEIPLFSPVTIGEDGDNPYLFNLAPSDRMKAIEFVRMLRTVHRDKQVVIVRDGGRFDRGFGQALITEMERIGLDFTSISANRNTNWAAYIKDGRYIVVHTTEDKNMLNAAVTGLMEFKEKVWLMGSSRWMNLNSVDYSFWSQLSVHFIGSDLADVPSARRLEMKRSFRKMYNGDPSTFAYSGYDQMRFACEVLDAFGAHFPTFVSGRSIQYTNTNIRLSLQDGSYQNQFLGLVAFNEDYSLRVVHIP